MDRTYFAEVPSFATLGPTTVDDPTRVVDAGASAIEQWAIRWTRRPGWPERSIQAERHCVALAAKAHLARKGVRVPTWSTTAEVLGAYLATADEDSRDLILGWIHVELLRRRHQHAPEGSLDDQTGAHA